MKKLLLFISMLVIIGFSAKAQYTKLFDFSNATGYKPNGSLIYDGTFLYGVTPYGGTNLEGTIFKIKPDGTGDTVLLNFNIANGKQPCGSLLYDGTYLYGMTTYGGTSTSCGSAGCGTLYKIKTDGTGFSQLLDFSVTAPGANPYGSLIYDGTYLYGMTNGIGISSWGTVFKILPNGSGYVKILNFNFTNGGNPTSDLYYDGTYLYGTAYKGGTGNSCLNNCGVVFKIKPDGTNDSIIHNFNMYDGAGPHSSLVSDGTFLYGMTSIGGANNLGTIFKTLPNGVGFDTLLSFNTTNGYNPNGSLIYDGTYLYGMAPSGGANHLGHIFRISPNGTGYKNLYDFTGVADGSDPDGSLLLQDRCLYGMTAMGGTNNGGTIFKFCDTTANGIKQSSVNNKYITVYPNPVTKNMTIESLQKSTMEILNIQGQTIIRQQIQQGKTDIDISRLAKGLYILRLCSNDKTEVTRFVKE